MTAAPCDPPIIIKRYGRRRLYEPATARYLTVDDLRDWADAGVPFVVMDTETGRDVTRVLLA